MTNRVHGVVALLIAASPACSPARIEGDWKSSGDDSRPAGGTPVAEANPFADLRTGEEQLKELCGRDGVDAVSKALCTEPRPEIHGLSDLQAVLGLAFVDRSPSGGNGVGGNPAFAITAHSSSLVAKNVSAINPRTIVFTPGEAGEQDVEFLALAFTRGDQFVELAVKAPPTEEAPEGELAFYLVKFEQECNASGGCSAGDLLTPRIEHNWTSWTLYEDEDLGNTVFDCLACHQPGGPDAPKMLRQQELHAPWTHFMKSDTKGGQALLADFHAAHGHDEDYGPIPAALIDASNPARLTDLLERNGFGQQPNEFKGALIEAEVEAANALEPAVNVPPGRSATWDAIYQEAVAGRAIGVPYHDVKVTDPEKLARATQAYADVLAGRAPASSLPDIRDVFLEDALIGMSSRPQPGLGPEAVLVEMCASCHNAKLDATQTRARFDVGALGAMDRVEKDKAIRRLQLPETNPGHMPPALIRSLEPGELDQVIELLRR